MILFDCDGVVLNSNSIKSDAMGETVKDYGEQLVEQFVDYHRCHGGISRYEKFDYFLRELADDYSAANYNGLLARFASLVEAKLEAAPMVEGVQAVLDEIPESAERYIVSGGDQAELNRVFRRRGLHQYFTAIFGSPTPKIVHCKQLRQTLGDDQRGILFGDSRLDHEAAVAGGFDFVFISSHTDFDDWSAYCLEHSLSHYPDFVHYLNEVTP